MTISQEFRITARTGSMPNCLPDFPAASLENHVHSFRPYMTIDFLSLVRHFQVHLFAWKQMLFSELLGLWYQWHFAELPAGFSCSKLREPCSQLQTVYDELDVIFWTFGTMVSMALFKEVKKFKGMSLRFKIFPWTNCCFSSANCCKYCRSRKYFSAVSHMEYIKNFCNRCLYSDSESVKEWENSSTPFESSKKRILWLWIVAAADWKRLKAFSIAWRTSSEACLLLETRKLMADYNSPAT